MASQIWVPAALSVSSIKRLKCDLYALACYLTADIVINLRLNIAQQRYRGDSSRRKPHFSLLRRAHGKGLRAARSEVVFPSTVRSVAAAGSLRPGPRGHQPRRTEGGCKMPLIGALARRSR